MLERPETSERTLLVHIKLRDPRATSDLGEFKELALSAGALVVDTIIITRHEIDPKFVIGKGKVEEIKTVIDSEDIDLLIFNYDLSPTQEKELEKALKCRVIDRTELILDIFAQRARTFEGKLQVELAQLQHLSTRLIRGWTHLERQKGGIGLRGGPGEKQLEIDRRLIRGRIKTIKARLEKVRLQRAQNRSSRHKAQISTVSLVGYTNAGKTTLFNTLTKEHQFAADKLFATLDPHLRQIDLRYVGKAIIADTVGFIRDLPHELIDAFRATLEETRNADLLIHVIDASDDLWAERKMQVEAVLHDIGATNVPILEVYNKIDLIDGITPGIETDHLDIISRVKISALKNIGIEDLKEAIAKRLCSDIVKGTLFLPHTYAKVRAKLYELGAIDNETEVLTQEADELQELIKLNKLKDSKELNEADEENITLSQSKNEATSTSKSNQETQIGKWKLDITLQQSRWKTLCKKFPELLGFFKI